FFDHVEMVCEELRREQSEQRQSSPEERPAFGPARAWSELRIRRPDLFEDKVTLPIQRLREALSELIKISSDKDIGQELLECNRRLAELREEVDAFLGQKAPDHVYWVERAGKTQKNLALNAAPIDVADFLRRRLFGSDTSVVMTSATLAMSAGERSSDGTQRRAATPGTGKSALSYFAHRVGA